MLWLGLVVLRALAVPFPAILEERPRSLLFRLRQMVVAVVPVVMEEAGAFPAALAVAAVPAPLQELTVVLVLLGRAIMAERAMAMRVVTLLVAAAVVPEEPVQTGRTCLAEMVALEC
jgi:hypothetical protein